MKALNIFAGAFMMFGPEGGFAQGISQGPVEFGLSFDEINRAELESDVGCVANFDKGYIALIDAQDSVENAHYRLALISGESISSVAKGTRIFIISERGFYNAYVLEVTSGSISIIADDRILGDMIVNDESALKFVDNLRDYNRAFTSLVSVSSTTVNLGRKISDLIECNQISNSE